jgi:hypothetical protein
MKLRRRIFALVAAFAVAFGALWPLVSVAQPGPRIPNVICTQGGFGHAPSQPSDHGAKVHCALCVASVDLAPPMPALLRAAALVFDAPAADPRAASLHPILIAWPPPSRAPPHRS